jgi:hypothetical protein
MARCRTLPFLALAVLAALTPYGLTSSQGDRSPPPPPLVVGPLVTAPVTFQSTLGTIDLVRWIYPVHARSARVPPGFELVYVEIGRLVVRFGAFSGGLQASGGPGRVLEPAEPGRAYDLRPGDQLAVPKDDSYTVENDFPASAQLLIATIAPRGAAGATVALPPTRATPLALAEGSAGNLPLYPVTATLLREDVLPGAENFLDSTAGPQLLFVETGAIALNILDVLGTVASPVASPIATPVGPQGPCEAAVSGIPLSQSFGAERSYVVRSRYEASIVNCSAARASVLILEIG